MTAKNPPAARQLPLPVKAISQHTLLLGKTRSGKSSKMRLIVESLLDAGKPVTIVEPKGDWWGIKSSADGKKAGYAVVIFGGEHADVPINATSGAAVAEIVATGNRPSLIDLSGLMVGERTRFWIDFASTFFRLARGQRWLVIDEVHNFAPQGKAYDVDSGKMLHWSNKLAAEGAGRGITLLSASQRPQKVHKDYVTSHETLIALRVIHPLDRGAVKDWIDGCGDPALGKEVLTTLASLQRSDGWVWSPEIGFGPRMVNFPLFSTYDSFDPMARKSVGKLKGWAAIDLDDVRSKLATAVAEAEQNDPKRLRARIAELEKHAGRPATKSVDAATPAAIAKAEKAAFAQGVEAGRQEGIAIGEKQGANAAFKAAAEAVQAARGGYTPPAIPVARQLKLVASEPVERAKAAATRRAPSPSAGEGLTGPQAKAMSAIATWAALGFDEPSRPEIAAVAGYSAKASTLNVILAELLSAGLVEAPKPGRIRMTAAGQRVAPEPSGQSGFDILANLLSNPEMKIVEALGGRELSRKELAAECGYSPTASTLNVIIASLKGYRIVEIPEAGVVKLADWVHPLMRKAA